MTRPGTTKRGHPRWRRRPWRDRKGRAEGFSLVDTVVGTTIFALAALGFVSVSTSAQSQEQRNRTTGQTTEMVRQVIEEIKSVPVTEAFARYNEDPADDPDGYGTASGKGFLQQFEGKEANQGYAHGYSSSATHEVSFDITLPITKDAAGKESLREDLYVPELGLPADLDGDGKISSADVSANLRYLPMVIQATWTEGAEQRSVTVYCTLSE